MKSEAIVVATNSRGKIENMNNMQTTQCTWESNMKGPQEFQASACGKAIIVGEHAVVYGTRAVAMPLPNMRFEFALQTVAVSDGKVPQVQLKLAGKNISARVQAVVIKAGKLLGLHNCSMFGRSQSALPIGAGLGSSATLCVAVLRALASSLGKRLSSSELAQMANELEKSFHGNPSGLDAAVVAFEECILFAKGPIVEPITIQHFPNSNWEFMLIDSGLRASTLAMIRVAEPFFKGSDGDKNLQAFDEISLQVFEALKSNQQELAGEAMNHCDQLLRATGVIPHAMAKIMDAVRTQGVLGVK